MENGEYVDGSYWFYAPNKVAPVIFASLFAVSCLWHAYQCFHYKCWKVSGILPWSGLIFVAGYVLREYGAFHYDNLNIYIASLVLLYAAPPLYEFSNYCVLSRIFYYVPYHAPMHPGRVLITFGALSAVIETINANGASKVANTSSSENEQAAGRALLKTALVLQLALLGLFILLAALFHRSCKRNNQLPKNVSGPLTTLYISSALIGIRTLYRTIEYFTAADLHFETGMDPNDLSPIIRYEWYFWVFEAALMICNTLILNVRHPMAVLPNNNKIYLALDGVTEVLGPGYEDERPWWMKFDLFDICGLIKGTHRTKKFWEDPVSNGGVPVTEIKTDMGKGMDSV